MSDIEIIEGELHFFFEILAFFQKVKKLFGKMFWLEEPKITQTKSKNWTYSVKT
jgi:hypothetical protein